MGSFLRLFLRLLILPSPYQNIASFVLPVLFLFHPSLVLPSSFNPPQRLFPFHLFLFLSLSFPLCAFIPCAFVPATHFPCNFFILSPPLQSPSLLCFLLPSPPCTMLSCLAWLKMVYNIVFLPREKEGVKLIEGSVVLMKKNVLDFNDLNACLLDSLHELIGRGVSFQLVSALHGDPGTASFNPVGPAS
ncbi:Lox9p [Asimina triloba]